MHLSSRHDISTAQGGRISFTQRFIPSPGHATVEVDLVNIEALCRSVDHPNHTTAILDYRSVSVISSCIDDQTEHEPIRLPSNAGTAWIGDMVRGIGGILEPAEAYALLERNLCNIACLFPYLNGTYLNSISWINRVDGRSTSTTRTRHRHNNISTSCG